VAVGGYFAGMPARLHLASRSQSVESSPQLGVPIGVVLADDHALVRRSLRLLLEREEDVEIVAEASDLSAVMRQVHGRLPHVLVLDLRLPNGSSVETIRRLRAQVPTTEIVVMTMEESPLFAQHAIDAGAIGFVLKDKADSELLTAIRCATQGDEYVSPRVAAGLDALRRAVGGDGLSPRETEVLRLIALGHTSAEIAAKLHLSRRTVETHRARIHRKLGLTTRAELVQFALGRHLIGT
jgi:two-component system, NarL family, response regulator NreC